ncbi:MAG: heme-binding protein [Candidatus Thermoplasmatota archaeon]|nr:heme-binding protein [Candidatus Thermoplasmatota archaeon]
MRQYPELILAFAEEMDDDSSFNLLFNYISGNNYTKDKIKMTAPVISKKNYMAFVLPSSYNKNTVLNPLNPNVKIDIQPKKQFAVLRFSGNTSEARVEKNGKTTNKLFKKTQISSLKTLLFL